MIIIFTIQCILTNVNIWNITLIRIISTEIYPQTNSIRLTWSEDIMTLETATNLAGPWIQLPGVGSPVTSATTNAARFFRLQQ